MLHTLYSIYLLYSCPVGFFPPFAYRVFLFLTKSDELITMTEQEWHTFETFRADFKEVCCHWLTQCRYDYAAPDEPLSCVEKSAAKGGQLHRLQKEAARENKTPDYPVETPIVYNHSLDGVQKSDTVKLIIVSDNPGKNEQLHKNQRYLVGQAGKVAESFFHRTPELGIDFRRDTIILNKTPIHTAKTKELTLLLKQGGDSFRFLFEESQRWLARRTAALQKALGCRLWLVGYGELRKKSLFTCYADELRQHYAGMEQEAPVFVFQHFSMNCFSIDLKKHSYQDKTPEENIRAIGLLHRQEILGW